MDINKLKPVLISGKEVLPIIEGGKGIGVSNGLTSGSFASSNAVGTFSGVNADSYDANHRPIQQVYKGKTRVAKHSELIEYAVTGGITQARIAREVAGSCGAIHMNILWEMGAAQLILDRVLSGTRGLVDGVTCGAGMPYKLAQIAAKYNVYYYPIISSMRAFRALWKRAYCKNYKLLGGVVYEDPWRAGGHNGLSNSEDPEKPEHPYPRVVEVRQFMNQVGLNAVPIIMAGGVWYLRDWENWLDNPEIGPIAFQFGTRPILTVESPVPNQWKQKLLTLKQDDVALNRFSPTGFYSSAVRNRLIADLEGRSERQIPYQETRTGLFTEELPFGPRKRNIYVGLKDKEYALQWVRDGYTESLKTPDSTIIFVTPEESRQIRIDQVNCMGCLSRCKFSNWKDHDDFTTGQKADPRSFCIQKTLQDVVHGRGEFNRQLMFAGHSAFQFSQDPFYKDGNIPTISELVERIMSGR